MLAEMFNEVKRLLRLKIYYAEMLGLKQDTFKEDEYFEIRTKIIDDVDTLINTLLSEIEKLMSKNVYITHNIPEDDSRDVFVSQIAENEEDATYQHYTTTQTTGIVEVVEVAPVDNKVPNQILGEWE